MNKSAGSSQESGRCRESLMMQHCSFSISSQQKCLIHNKSPEDLSLFAFGTACVVRRNRTFDAPVKHGYNLAHARPTYDSCLHPQYKVAGETTAILDHQVLSKIIHDTKHVFIFNFWRYYRKIENNQMPRINKKIDNNEIPRRIRYIKSSWKFATLRGLKLRFSKIQFWYEMKRKLPHWSSFAKLSCPVGRFAHLSDFQTRHYARRVSDVSELDT